MALPADSSPPPSPERRARGSLGWTMLGLGLVAAMVLAVMPAPYVIKRPGPVIDTLGTIGNGQDVPLIAIPDATTYPTEGSLDLLTVSVVGNRERLPGWFDVVASWFDPTRAAVPVDSVFPPGVTTEQAAEQSRLQMENSKREAIAAALTELGHELPSRLTIAEVIPGGPSEGLLQAGDVVLSFDGTVPRDTAGLLAAIAKTGVGGLGSIVVLRNGVERTFEISPVAGRDPERPTLIGVYVAVEYEFPFDVDIQLQKVGGPSAGLMFALGIIDKLTPGALTGGERIAGTGEISASGQVGAIGGIRQKLYGARDAGADWFLAPAGNCGEVVGHVPDGIEVFRVATLDDALAVLEGIRDGDTSGLPRCEG